MQLYKARKVANDVLYLLSPYYQDAVICGSIRRGVSEVKDIDLVLLSNVEVIERQASLLPGLPGDHIQVVDHLLNQLTMVMERGGELDVGIEVVSVGSTQHKLRIQGIDIEVYTVDCVDKMGVAVVLRTGPAEFSRRLCTFALFKHWHITGHQLHLHEKGGRQGHRIECELGSRCERIAFTPTESDLFSALGLPYIEPEARTPELLQKEEKRGLNLRNETVWP